MESLFQRWDIDIAVWWSILIGLGLAVISLVIAYYVPLKLTLLKWWIIMVIYMFFASRLPNLDAPSAPGLPQLLYLASGVALGALALIVWLCGFELPALST